MHDCLHESACGLVLLLSFKATGKLPQASQQFAQIFNSLVHIAIPRILADPENKRLRTKKRTP